MSLGGIYEILNTVNGKRYIGSTCGFEKRWRAHRSELRAGKHQGPKLQNAWNKYGERAFQFNIMLLCPDGCLREREQQYIDVLLPEYNTASNVVACMLGRKHSLETLRKISLANSGRIRTAQAKEKMSIAHAGVPKSVAHRAAIGAANLGRAHSQEMRDKVSLAQSRNMTPERRARIGDQHRGKILSPTHRAALLAATAGRVKSLEERAKLSAAMKGRVFTPETIMRMSAAAKRRWAYAHLMQAQGTPA